MIGTDHSSQSAVSSNRGRKKVLGCLALVVVLGLVLVVWLGVWWARRGDGEMAERARQHHLLKLEEERLRSEAEPDADPAPDPTELN